MIKTKPITRFVVDFSYWRISAIGNFRLLVYNSTC